MKTKIGTSHFETLEAATRYYSWYELTWYEVQEKIDNGEIHIGPPSIKPGERLLVDKDGRYFIEIS